MELRRAATRLALACIMGAGFASADMAVMTDVEQYNALVDQHDGFPHQNFESSNIIAPVFQLNSVDHDLTDDSPYIFIGSVYGHMKGGPMILNATDLSLVYADQKYENAYHAELQTIFGKDYMTFWEGYHARGHANGFCLVVDEKYHIKYNVSAVGLHGALADMHELEVTDDNTIIFSTYWNVPYDSTELGGPKDGLLINSGFQEVDIETNELLFEWSALDHFDPKNSFAHYKDNLNSDMHAGYDWFHINSITKTKAGNYLMSGRHLSLVALIDGTDGHPIWVLGGKTNQFEDLSDGKATNFGWQHDARFYHDESHITMFDNHGEHTGSCEEGNCHSRGLHLEIDEKAMTARVVHEYYHPQHIDAGAMGGLQTLKNGNVMTAWGHSPGFVEFTEDGRVAMDVQRGRLGRGTLGDMFMYRVHKGNWTGRPDWPPSIQVKSPHQNAENASVYTSWNGATDVAEWAYFTSDDPREIEKHENFVGKMAKTGFETVASLGPDRTTRYVAAAAIGHDGEVMGSTVVFDMKDHKPYILKSDPSKFSMTAPSHLDKIKEHPGNVGAATAGLLIVAAGISVIVWMCRRRRTRGAHNIDSAKYYPVAVSEQEVSTRLA